MIAGRDPCGHDWPGSGLIEPQRKIQIDRQENNEQDDRQRRQVHAGAAEAG